MGPPMMHPRRDMGSMMTNLTLIFRLLGFILLFVGTLVVVAYSVPGGACFTPPPNNGTPACATGTTWNQGEWTGVMAARILWTIGLFFIGLGAGMKIHFNLQAPQNGTPELYQFVAKERFYNGLMLMLTIFLMFVLLMWPLYAPLGVGV